MDMKKSWMIIVVFISVFMAAGCSTVYSISNGETAPYSGTTQNIQTIKAVSGEHRRCGLPNCNSNWELYGYLAMADFLPGMIIDTLLFPSC
ncbi:hypothetical protein PY479_02245 [Shewanella sp. A32]|uniref:hypothetical protein n=1 Tax=Shewanella sp. A32 TaxID=3031327 RepID=UPI0023B94C11|nr:hypothetical protein [Shewanella sp. A32]MDF0533097.1 hypothetical protein [Shewanella sp. A32]